MIKKTQSIRVTRGGKEISLLLHGLATYYRAREGTPTKSGESYHADSPTCAVDISEWRELRNHSLLVFDLTNDRCQVLRVNDTGYLYRAGRFIQGVRWGIARWWPSREGLRVVVDIPERTFKENFGNDTLEIFIYDLGLDS